MYVKEDSNFEIKWTIIEDGDRSILKGFYRDVVLTENFNDSTMFNLSLKRAKKRLKRKFKLLD